MAHFWRIRASAWLVGYVAGVLVGALILVASACASTPPGTPVPKTSVTIHNENQQDAVVYSFPCGVKTCPQKLIDVFGRSSRELSTPSTRLGRGGYALLAARVNGRYSELVKLPIVPGCAVEFQVGQQVGVSWGWVVCA